MDISLFHIESIGRAANNRTPSSPLLEIYPIEIMGYADGEITDNYVEDEVEGIDAFGQKYRVAAKATNTIQATWLPIGSNRNTPPDIRRGERVLILRFGDADVYYWSTTGLDEYLRRLETVVYTFSNTRDESVTQLTPDNSWYIKVCTRTKNIIVKTNKSDGEKVSYSFEFDIAKGVVTLKDDMGNFFTLSSFERMLKLQNSDSSIFEINKTVANLITKDAINLTTKNYTLKCSNNNVDATSSITYKSPTYSIDANTSTVGTLTNNGINVSSSHIHPESIGSVTGGPQ